MEKTFCGYQKNYTYPCNEEKRRLQKLDSQGRPSRVLCRWGGNPRIVVLDPALNPEGYTYQQMFQDPFVPPIIQSRFQEYWFTTISKTCDMLEELPEVWDFSVENHNVYDAAYFGAEILYPAGQVPSTRHPYLGLDDLDSFMKRDIDHPLDNPYVKDRLKFRDALIKSAENFSYLGRKGRVHNFNLRYDGPLTAAFMIFGEDIFCLMSAEPEKAKALFLFITKACIIRNQALRKLAGSPMKDDWGDLADDAIELVSTQMLEEQLFPSYELWYSQMSTTTALDRRRSLHCCGDGTRHFKAIAEKLGVSAFDTGFPVDHGALRRELGPDIHISGGSPIYLFTGGTPQQLFDDTRRILTSGVKEGCKFGLREGNNLPPCVPLENLSAVYQACIEYGRYE